MRKKTRITDEFLNLQVKISSIMYRLTKDYNCKQEKISKKLDISTPKLSSLKLETKNNIKNVNELLKYYLLLENLLQQKEIESLKNFDCPQNNNKIFIPLFVYHISNFENFDIEIDDVFLKGENKMSEQTFKNLFNSQKKPQQDTIRKICEIIIKAYDSKIKQLKEKFANIKKNINFDTPVVNIAFDRKNIEKIYSGLQGVYIIYDIRGYPSYIGKGDIKNRLANHCDEANFINKKLNYTFSYFVTDKAIYLEKILIQIAGNTLLFNEKNKRDYVNEKYKNTIFINEIENFTNENSGIIAFHDRLGRPVYIECAEKISEKLKELKDNKEFLFTNNTTKIISYYEIQDPEYFNEPIKQLLNKIIKIN